MKMTLETFQNLSTRTAMFNAQTNVFVERREFLANYSIGLVGEHFEYQQALNKIGDVLSKENIEEVEKECGDVMHYAVNLLTFLEEELDGSKLKTNVTIQDMDKALGDILEITKKHLYHGHDFKKEEFLDAIYTVIGKYVEGHRTSLSGILNKNIEKLKIRYPEKFSIQDSIHRVDVK